MEDGWYHASNHTGIVQLIGYRDRQVWLDWYGRVIDPPINPKLAGDIIHNYAGMECRCNPSE